MARTCNLSLLFTSLLVLTALCAPASGWDGDGGFDADYSRITRLRWTGPGTPGTYEEYLQHRKSLPVSADLVHATSARAGIAGRASKALVLVESTLSGSIQPNLTRYVTDLENDGYTVEVYEITGGTPASLKFFIRNHTTDLAGCVFVGDLPVAWYESEIWGHEEFPCDLYFMDLDGTWQDNDSDGMFDSHTAGNGDVGPEIFIGHIDTSMMSGDEASLTNDYLDKNHSYWSGGIFVPHHALSYTEDDWAMFMDMRTDIQYAYPEFDDIPAPATERYDYVDNRVPNPEYEFIQLCCHSSSEAHYFTRGGLAYNFEIQAVVPHAMFYNLFCCSTLRFTDSDFLGGAYIYDTSETSVAVIGSTKTGSMLVFSAFYQPFGAGECFGEAFRQWFNYLAPYDSEEIAWHYGMTIAGDPFLHLRENDLSVTPLTGFESAGDSGGPFTPSSIVYTLENHSASGIEFSVTATEPWVTLSDTSGYLPGQGTAMVTVSINSGADTLPVGPHTATIEFINNTTHVGDTTREVTLQVGLPTVQYQWTLDSDPGWTTEDQWALGTPTGGGGEYGYSDPTSGHSGSNVYGYNLAGDYPADLPERNLTSAAINCSDLAMVSVKFQRWLNVETSVYDHAYFRVSNDGTNWTTIWENSGEITDSSWNQVEYDLSAVADNEEIVYLRWTMGTTDSGWQYSGWNIDDIEIWGTPLSGPQTTISAELGCLPVSGTVPFTGQFSVDLSNLCNETARSYYARIRLELAGGQVFPAWRFGNITVGAGSSFATNFNQTFPVHPAVIGSNMLTLIAEDITPSPYNQPPYPASGDTATAVCTVEGLP